MGQKRSGSLLADARRPVKGLASKRASSGPEGGSPGQPLAPSLPPGAASQGPPPASLWAPASPPPPPPRHRSLQDSDLEDESERENRRLAGPGSSPLRHDSPPPSLTLVAWRGLSARPSFSLSLRRAEKGRRPSRGNGASSDGRAQPPPARFLRSKRPGARVELCPSHPRPQPWNQSAVRAWGRATRAFQLSPPPVSLPSPPPPPILPCQLPSLSLSLCGCCLRTPASPLLPPPFPTKKLDRGGEGNGSQRL